MQGLASIFLGFFKGANPLSWLLNKYVIGGIAVALAIGYVYHKGKVSERHRQANEIADLNTKIADLNAGENKAHSDESARMTTAVDRAIENISRRPLGDVCSLDESTILDINKITRGL